MQTATTKRVAERVRHAMSVQGVTQVALAESLGMSQQSISRRVRGAQPFDVEELTRVASLLRVDVRDLIGDVAA